MSAVLVLWLLCGFLADLPTAFSRPRLLSDGYGSGIEADESAKRQSSGCGSFNYANNTLTSPGYPSYYPSYIDCEYLVPIPSGKAMRIDFVAFDVESHAFCNWDYLKITNEKNQTFGKYCGVKDGYHVIVTGDYVVLKFHSDCCVARPGYLLSFNAFSNGTQSPPTALPTAPPTAETMPPPTPNVTGCGYVQYDELTSPGYPGYYPSNMDCTYSIYIPHGKALKIDFQYFRINDCWYDYVKINNEQNQTFGTFCGDKTGQVVYVTGYYAVVTFHSDNIINGPGYKLVFSKVPQANFSTSAPWPPYTSYPTYPPYTSPSGPYPSYYPSVGPKGKLQFYIHILEIVLNEMDRVVKYELGSKFSAREYKARVKRALSNVQAAKKRVGGQKRDVREVRKVDELENRAAELLKRLDTEEAQSKMRALLNRKMAETRAENAPIEAY